MSDEEDIFEQALRIRDPRERQAFLDRACAAQPQLREQVEELLKAHEQTSGILDSPVVQVIDAPVPEQPGTLVGNYKLLGQIGEGGMGMVYMAEQLRPVKRRVALKILKPGLDTKQVIARFEAERQALAMMDHPNIARVFDAGVTETGRPYFAMELVRGIPITQYCDQDRLTPRQRLELFVQVCQAVQHAHQKGIIHRDLKPTNVLVTLADDGKPVSKIIDFGIAKATGGQRLVDQTLFTEFRQLIGTPLYMSPEQAERSAVQDVDTRSDVYSLGVLLYELLTGTTPFDKNRLATAAFDEVRRIIREEEPPKPSTRLSTLGHTLGPISTHRQMDPKKLSQTVRGELDWIVMKALEKDRARRYGSPNGLAHDIERYLTDQPVEAYPPSSLYRLQKAMRKHRLPIATAAAFVLMLVATTIVSSWIAVRQTRKASAAEISKLQLVREKRAGELNQASLLLWRADQMMFGGKWNEVGPVVDQALRLYQENAGDPDAQFLYMCGSYYGRLGRIKEAAPLLLAAIAAKPDDVEYWHEGVPLLPYLGQDAEFQRRRHEELRRFAATTDVRTAHVVAKDALGFPISGEDLQVALALAQSGKWRGQWGPNAYVMTMAMAEYRSGKYEQAQQWLAACSRDNSYWDVDVKFFQAMCLYHLKNSAAASVALKDAEQLMKTRLPALGERMGDSRYNLAQDWVLCQCLHREAEAMILNGPVATSTDKPRENQTQAQTRPQQHQDIDERLLEELANDPATLGRVYLSRHDIRSAIDAYDEALHRQPDRAALWAARGECYRQSGDFDLMRQDYVQASRLDPINKQYFIELGNADMLLGDRKQSIVDHSSAIALGDTNANARLRRGMSYQALEQFPQALNDYSRAIELDPRFWGNWFARARLYSRMGEHDKAKADVANALKNSPGDMDQNNMAWGYLAARKRATPSVFQ